LSYLSKHAAAAVDDLSMLGEASAAAAVLEAACLGTEVYCTTIAQMEALLSAHQMQLSMLPSLFILAEVH